MLQHVVRNLVHLRRSQRWSRARMLRSQRALLVRLVREAQADVPLYRELYAPQAVACATEADDDWFRALPIVQKADLKRAFPDRIVSDAARGRVLQPIATSGTTDRVMLFHDDDKRNWDRAADLLLAFEGDGFRPGHRRMIIPPDACYERCGADEHGRTETVATKLRAFLRAARAERALAGRQLAAQMVRDWFWREKLLKALGVDGTATPGEALDEYLDEIAAWRPRMLSALPMFLHVLAERLRETQRVAPAARLRPSGGKLSPRMIAMVERGFGGRVRENFGTAELGTIAYDCPENRQQHLLNELFVVEFLRGGAPVGPGELGELIITDLRNRAAPLIRYAIGDVGRYEEAPCRCGRNGLLFTVHGRLDETVVTPDGATFAGDELIDFFLAQPAIRYAKLIQQAPERFLLEYVPRPGERPPARDALSGEFGELLGCRARVEPREVRRIAPERSGKYKLVHSCTHAAFHEPVRARPEVAPSLAQPI